MRQDKLIKVSKQETERFYAIAIEKIQKDRISHARKEQK
jgi:predicted HTH domain antitoxin